MEQPASEKGESARKSSATSIALEARPPKQSMLQLEQVAPARTVISPASSTKVVTAEANASKQSISDILLKGEEPTQESLEDFAALNDALPISDEELERQALGIADAANVQREVSVLPKLD